jgi:hypothetical protein
MSPPSKPCTNLLDQGTTVGEHHLEGPAKRNDSFE